MTTLETLKAARAKIADSKHWTRGEYARNKHSRAVPVDSAEACRWCSSGAVRAVADGPRWEAEMVLRHHASETLWHYNDTHSHSEVLALFDKAIASLEAA